MLAFDEMFLRDLQWDDDPGLVMALVEKPGDNLGGVDLEDSR